MNDPMGMRNFQSFSQLSSKGSTRSIDKQIGDVVVYTEGSISDYVIQKSIDFDGAIEVLKSDGTKDLLFNIPVIKFETEDVSIIPISNETDALAVSGIDIFDNDISNRI